MRTRSTPSSFFLAFLIGGLGVLVLHTAAGFGGSSLNGLFSDGVYNVLMFGAALTVLTRGVLVRAQRAAWLTMGAGVLSWSLGELYYTLFLESPGVVAGQISPADVLYLAFYPCCYVALVLLVGAHLRELRIGMWLDGLIGGLAAATVGAALDAAADPPVDPRRASASVAVATAYPIGDLLLLVFTMGALGMTGWRPGRVWLLIAASLLVSAVADSLYLYRTAAGTYQAGMWLDCLWPASAILLALAAWTPWPKTRRRRVEDWRLMSVPTLSLLVALGVLIYGNRPDTQLTPVAVILAGATVLAVGVHLMLDRAREPRDARRLARTGADRSAHGPGQPTAFDRGPARRLPRGRRGEPWELVLYDLNGFKRYNDTFGHPPATRCWRASSGKLSERGRRPTAPPTAWAATSSACSRRVGAPAPRRSSRRHLEALVRAGRGLLDIDAAYGVRQHPRRGRASRRRDHAARRPAPVRAQGPARESSAVHQLRDVLLQAFQERDPDLQEHLRGRRRTGARRRPAHGHGRRGPRRPRARRRAARRRQDRDPRCDPRQAGPARRGGVGVHAPPHDPRRAHPDGRIRAAPGGAAGALQPRALRRAAATPTGSRARRSRSAHASSSSATPTTR